MREGAAGNMDFHCSTGEIIRYMSLQQDKSGRNLCDTLDNEFDNEFDTTHEKEVTCNPFSRPPAACTSTAGLSAAPAPPPPLLQPQ